MNFSLWHTQKKIQFFFSSLFFCCPSEIIVRHANHVLHVWEIKHYRLHFRWRRRERVKKKCNDIMVSCPFIHVRKIYIYFYNFISVNFFLTCNPKMQSIDFSRKFMCLFSTFALARFAPVFKAIVNGIHEKWNMRSGWTGWGYWSNSFPIKFSFIFFFLFFCFVLKPNSSMHQLWLQWTLADDGSDENYFFFSSFIFFSVFISSRILFPILSGYFLLDFFFSTTLAAEAKIHLLLISSVLSGRAEWDGVYGISSGWRCDYTKQGKNIIL